MTSASVTNPPSDPETTIPLRKRMRINKFVKMLTEILERDQGSVPAPCIRSKLDAALEHVLLNRIFAESRYDLVTDADWPVNRQYEMTPKPYSFFYTDFTTTILMDEESLYISCYFDELHYRVFKFHKLMVPFFDTNFQGNIEKIEYLYKTLFFRYFCKVRRRRYGTIPPKLSKFETTFAKTKIPTLSECRGIGNTAKSTLYKKISSVKENVDPLEEGMQPMYRLYRIIVPLLSYQGYEVVDESKRDTQHYILKRYQTQTQEQTSVVNESEPVQMKKEYKGESITVEKGTNAFKISFAEGIHECYFILRVSVNHYIRGKLIVGAHTSVQSVHIRVTHIQIFYGENIITKVEMGSFTKYHFFFTFITSLTSLFIPKLSVRTIQKRDRPRSRSRRSSSSERSSD